MFWKKEKNLNWGLSYYNFSFISLVPITVGGNEALVRGTSVSRLRVKQFFLSLAWFCFLSNSSNKDANAKVIGLPSRTSKFTTLRAPIAHKKWSKEQFQISFFRVAVKFCVRSEILSTPHVALFLMSQMSSSFREADSNLLFCRFISISILLNSRNILQS